jgi:uncharacterized protein (TIGR02246 family)
MRDELQDEAQAFLDEFRKAWDAGDAKSFAALFTHDATYVIFLGEALVGRDEIEADHAEVFGRWQKGTRMAIKTVRFRALAKDVCSVLTLGGIGRKTPIAYDKLQTITLAREGGRWLCAAFQNTAMSDSAKAAFSPGELDSCGALGTMSAA